MVVGERMKEERVVKAMIGLGSNLGDGLTYLRSARDALKRIAASGEGFAQSSIYRSDPVGCPPGAPDFLNAVVVMGWTGTALELLAELQGIERANGRVRNGEVNEPRTLDLDLLVFGDQRVELPDLVLPHPRFHERRFVLEPLAEIQAEMEVPHFGRSVADLLAGVEGEPLDRVHDEW